MYSVKSMKVPSERQAVSRIAERLAELVDPDHCEVRMGDDRSDRRIDAVIRAGVHVFEFVFEVEWQSIGTAGAIAVAIERVRRRAEEIERIGKAGKADGKGRVIPLLAVPFMGEVGRGLCERFGVAWLDLSGNARIFTPGLRILIEGKPNRYKRRGRPSTAFAPKGSRIARWLLMHPTEPFTQRKLALATGMDEGYTSRVVGKLEEEGLIVRDDGVTVRPRDPGLLLDAWLESYDFKKHHLIRGHVAARSGDALLRQLIDGLGRASASCAATGLAAAWSLGRFAGFRTVSLYLRQEPSTALLAALSFREDARGANVWLIVPNDKGVFHGATVCDGVLCVHPVQAYLDLHAHPERAEDVARTIRSEYLQWKADD